MMGVVDRLAVHVSQAAIGVEVMAGRRLTVLVDHRLAELVQNPTVRVERMTVGGRRAVRRGAGREQDNRLAVLVVDRLTMRIANLPARWDVVMLADQVAVLVDDRVTGRVENAALSVDRVMGEVW